MKKKIHTILFSWVRIGFLTKPRKHAVIFRKIVLELLLEQFQQDLVSKL
jgi:hypothetical protein